jgi:hypothetical protein
MLSEITIRWCRIHRIPTKYHQQLHLTSRHVPDQRAQRRQLIYRLGRHWRRVRHGMARVTQHVIHGMRQGMDQRRLLPSGYDQASPAVLPQVLSDSPDPARLHLRGRGVWRQA